MDRPRLALLGLGVMGSRMARHLLDAGFPLTVYNRRPEKAAELGAAGARVASSLPDAATDADIVIAMVADDRASRAVWLGETTPEGARPVEGGRGQQRERREPGEHGEPGRPSAVDDRGAAIVRGALAGVKPGALLIESSTLSVGWVRELSRAAQAVGAELIDAPVTGSREQAAAQQLLFLVGGSADALERARPVLAVMSRGIVHVGPIGSGALLKLVNNFLSGVQAAALAEAVTFVEHSDLNRETALDVLMNGAPGSPLVKTLTPRMTAREYVPPHFSLQLMAKDIAYARAEAAQRGVQLETATCILSLIERAIADGHADSDFSAIVEGVRQRAAAPRA